MSNLSISSNWTEDALRMFAENAIPSLGNLTKSSNFREMTRLFKQFAIAYDSEAATSRITFLVETLNQLNFAENFTALLIHIDQSDPINKQDVWDAYRAGLSVVWNLSDACFSLASRLVIAGCGQVMIRNCTNKKYLADMTNSKYFYIVKASISTINNMIRFPGYRDQFDTVEVKDALVFLSNSSDSFIQSLGCLCLVHLINENEGHLLKTAENASVFINRVIKEARASSTGRYRGFTTIEMLQGLKSLSANDNAKQGVVNAGCLDVIKLILSRPKNDEEVEEALAILWNLSFDEQIKKVIEDKGLVRLASKFEGHKCEPIKINAAGVLSRCEVKNEMNVRIKSARATNRGSRTNAPVAKATASKFITSIKDKRSLALETSALQSSAKTPSPPPPPPPAAVAKAPPPSPQPAKPQAPPPEITSSPNFHVFVSYCHQNKDIIYPVINDLKKKNINCWLDVEQIKGSTLEAMAEGIEGSQIILMGMSEGYKQSPNCRTEAEYAFYLQKPIVPLIVQAGYRPNGWLGMLLGTKMYFDFCGSNEFKVTVDNLMNELLKQLN